MGKSHWNYRVAKTISGGESLFLIIECYYNENGIADRYVNGNILANWSEYEDLKGTYSLLGKAFEKPIIDLDNFPNELS